MNYLIVTNCYEPFYTNWFDAENNFNKDIDMVVFNLISNTYTTDGITCSSRTGSNPVLTTKWYQLRFHNK